MKYISLVFDEDLHRNDVEAFKDVHDCMGVSAYRNTVNLYFKNFDRLALLSLATVLQHQLVGGGSSVQLQGHSVGGDASIREIYGSLREELAL